MKKIYALLMLLAVMLTTLTMPAYGRTHNDEEEIDPSAIVGTWQLISIYSALKDPFTDIDIEEVTKEYIAEYMQIKADGSYETITIRKYDPVNVSYGQWALKNDAFTRIIDDRDGKQTSTSQVVHLSNQQFTIYVSLGLIFTYVKIHNSTINRPSK